MAEPVNALAAYLSPEQRRRIGNALMAGQYDRATPEEGNVSQRHGMLPLATYDNGRTGLAFPGIVAEPVESFNRLLQNGYTSGDAKGVEDAFNVAGAAMMGGLAAPRPKAEPLIGYRGSASSGGTFKDRNYVFASSDPANASQYALDPWMTHEGTKASPSVMPMEFRFKNPMEVNAGGRKFDARGLNPEELLDLAARRGHDGLVVKNYVDPPYLGAHMERPQTTIAAFKRGTVYSPLTGELLYANGGKQGAATGAAVNALSETPGIRAYHGSPHDFDRFDLSKIGTGEGAQAYGHGLYFAENEGVAKTYRGGNIIGPAATAEHYINLEGSREKALKFAKGVLKSAKPGLFNKGAPDQVAHWQRVVDYLKSDNQPGKMYEVRINANPDDFLDWDKPLIQQSERVRGILNNIPEANRLMREAVDPELGPWTGSDLINEIHSSPDRTWTRNGVTRYDPEIAQVLKDQGIPGIRYLDQGSRGAGEGSRNYVVFDDKLVEILRKYGLLGMAGGAAAAEYSQPANSLMQPRPASPRYLPGDA